MIAKIEATIKKYSLISEGDTVLVGLSGGADSVALTLALMQLSEKLGFSVCCAHLNHGIRGETADRDEAFVSDICEFYGLPLYIERLDVPDEARRTGMTLEQAGRVMRYDFLARAKERFHAKSIAVAHHMDDQAESILLHLTRGSGLLGLVGMQPRRGDVIRPLINVRRSEIEAYLSERETAYCTDETNLVREGTRNRIRLDVIPYIEKYINPAIVPALCSMGELLYTDEQYLDREATAALNAAKADGICNAYDRAALKALPTPIRTRAIRIALRQAGAATDIERIHVEQVDALLCAKTGTRLHLPHVSAWTAYGNIVFGTEGLSPAFETPLAVPGVTQTPAGSFSVDYIEGCGYERRPDVAYMDADKVPPVLTVRTRRDGDRFYPLGAPGRRKLKDYFIDRKVPRVMRDAVPMVTAGAEVLFLPGFSVSETVRVEEKTVRMLRIVYTHNND